MSQLHYKTDAFSSSLVAPSLPGGSSLSGKLLIVFTRTENWLEWHKSKNFGHVTSYVNIKFLL